MSLLYWWPLTEGLQDRIQGVSFKGNATGAWESFVDGKIGKCHGTATGQQIYTTLTIPQTFSFAFWAKNNDLAYPKTTAPMYFGPGAIFQNGNPGWDYGHRANGESGYYKYRVTLNDGTNSASNFYWDETGYNPLDLLGSWYHIAVTIDRKKQKINLYVNAHPMGEQDIPSTLGDFGGTRNFLMGALSGWKLDGYMNDLRIYDHVLSINEIKELSKALMVHYTFNDILTEPTVNLLPLTQQTQSNTAAAIEVTEGLVDGATYTLSTYVTRDPACTSTNPRLTLRFFYSDGTNTAVSKYNDGGVSYPKDGKERYYYITATANSQKTLIQVGGWLLDHSSGSGKKMTATRSQLEIKDHPTPYTPSSREAMIIDESGYNHSTALYNNCELTTDTSSGSLALHTAGLPDRIDHDNCSYLKSDIGSLITPTEFTISFNAKVNQWGAQTSGILSLNADHPEPTGYLTSTFVQYDSNFRLNNSASTAQASIGYSIITVGEWHHYAFVWDGSTLIGYRDGMQYGTPVAAAFTPDPFRYIYLGYDRAGGAGRDADVTWGDFRLYTTALDADEVLDLAKTKTYITNKGDIETNEFIEGAEAEITQYGQCKTGKLWEALTQKDGSIVEYVDTNNNYFNTGVKATNDTKIILDAQVIDTRTSGWLGLLGGDSYLMGAETGSVDMAFGIYVVLTDNAHYIYFGDTAAAGTAKIVPDKQRHIYSLDKTGLAIDDQYDYVNPDPGEHSAEGPIVLGGFWRNNGVSTSKVRIYDCRIFENNVEIKHYIPWVDENEKPCLLDILNNEICLPSSGSAITGPYKNEIGFAEILSDGDVGAREIIEI